LSMSSTLSPTKIKFSSRRAIPPSLEISAQHDLENAPVLSKTPSLGRNIFGFGIAFCLGVAATSGWQSYGDAARGVIANWSEQFGWLAPAPDAHASIIAPTAVVAPSSEIEEQAPEREVLQKISEPLSNSPDAPTPSQVVGPLDNTFVEPMAAPK